MSAKEHGRPNSGGWRNYTILGCALFCAVNFIILMPTEFPCKNDGQPEFRFEKEADVRDLRRRLVIAEEADAEKFKWNLHTSQKTFSEKEKAIKPAETWGQTAHECGHDHIKPWMPRRGPVLDKKGELYSTLWVDMPNAHDILKTRLEHGMMTQKEADLLAHFIDHGFMELDLELDDEIYEDVDRFFDEIWKVRPANCLAKHATVNNNEPLPMDQFPEEWVTNRPGTKILEAHSHSDLFASLVYHPTLHRMVHLILEDVPVATQSLLFGHGSGQNIHRDPWYVVTTPASSMVASWLALEDIHPDSGPLAFYPDSHRMPFTPTLSNGDIISHQGTPESVKAHADAMWEEIEARGLKREHFTPKKGKAIMWHAGLVHGGSDIKDPSKSRKSFVVHYDKLRYHPMKGVTTRRPGGDMEQFVTTKIVEKNCRYSFMDPMLDADL